MPHWIQMSDHGIALATRARGAELRRQVLEATDDSPDVVIDFGGVLSVSSSFVDEFLGKLAVDINSGEPVRRVEVTNARDEVKGVVDTVLERRRQIAEHGPLAMPL